MGSWKIVSSFILPPAVVLTVLLVLPLPPRVRKALLQAIERFLTLLVVGSIQLVHLMIVTSGVIFATSIRETWRLSEAVNDPTLTPNQRTGALAKKWREERNFWIGFMTFLLWSLLARFFQIVSEKLEYEDKVFQYEAQLGITPPRTQVLDTGVKWVFFGKQPKHPTAHPDSEVSGEPSAPPEPHPEGSEAKKLQ